MPRTVLSNRTLRPPIVEFDQKLDTTKAQR